MLEAVSRQRKKGLDLPDRIYPQPQCAAVRPTPALRRECDLDGVHQGSVDDADKDVVTRIDPVDQSPEARDRLRARHAARQKVALQRLQSWRLEFL